jgi:hypothetical protein
MSEKLFSNNRAITARAIVMPITSFIKICANYFYPALCMA